MRRGACVRIRASAGACCIRVGTASPCGSSTICLSLCLVEAGLLGTSAVVSWGSSHGVCRGSGGHGCCVWPPCLGTSAGGCALPLAEECACRRAKSGALVSNQCGERNQALLMLREGVVGISEHQSQRRTVRTPFRTSLLCLLRLLLHRQGAAPRQHILCLCSARIGNNRAVCVSFT